MQCCREHDGEQAGDVGDMRDARGAVLEAVLCLEER